MATSNFTVTGTYQNVVSAAATWFLISSRTPELIEIATTAANGTLPDAAIEGHVIKANSGITRALLSGGAVFVRTAARNKTGHTVKISVDAG